MAHTTTDTMTGEQRCQAYILNGYICSYFDNGEKPTVESLRKHWSAESWKDLSDELIEQIILQTEMFY
jgi:hypothetical protein